MLVLFEKILTRVSHYFAIIGAIGIIALMLITLATVIWRYIIKDPIFGISDLSVVTLSIVAAASVGYGARHEAHVSVNIITFFFGRNITRYTDVLMRFLTFMMLMVAAYALLDKACGFEGACVTDNLSIEHRPFFYILSVCMLFYAFHVLWQLLLGLKHFNGIDPNEPTD